MIKYICKRCESEKVVKAGLSYNTTKNIVWQRYKCKQCHFNFKAEKKYILPEPKFVYQNQVHKKTDWTSLTNAQTNEYEMFNEVLLELLDLIVVEHKQKTGRPSADIKDVLYCMLTKTYRMISSRRLSSDLKTAEQLGHISKAPTYSSLMYYFNDKRLKPILTELIELSATPIASLDESQFAADASGFSVSKFGRWYDWKFRKESEKRLYRKLHLACGTMTNIITSVTLTNQYSGDAPELKTLVKRTALSFNIKEFSADRAYISRGNLEAIRDAGALPVIPFKSNTRPHGGKNGLLWRKLYVYFKDNPQEFFEKYHRRSNVESVFFMLKQKFGDSLMTKNLMANYNEILCKVLAHNICILIRCFFEFGLTERFSTENPKLRQIKISV